MRAIDLAIYADSLAAEASALAARLERARGRLRQAAIELQARQELEPSIVARLELRGLFATVDVDSARAEIEELAGSLSALQTLQTWVERELFAAREEGFAMSE
jgi:hypothetical protein